IATIDDPNDFLRSVRSQVPASGDFARRLVFNVGAALRAHQLWDNARTWFEAAQTEFTRCGACVDETRVQFQKTRMESERRLKQQRDPRPCAEELDVLDRDPRRQSDDPLTSIDMRVC